MINMKKQVLENGLTVFYFPKKGFSKTFAILATNYGAVDSIFSTNEGDFETPQGVAHFLEHKMFEQKDGTNALGLFSKTGASPNAFTSQTMTAYHFECTSNYKENMKILLDFVANPYFTDENVDKEQGIIGQEIKMVEDTPNWVAFVNIFKALYHNHPIKESIIGTVESISEIDKEILYLCHKTFYNASNMVLCIAGDIDLEWTVKTANEMYPKPQVSLKSRDYKTEPASVCKPEIMVNMEVAMPLFIIGFKDNTGSKNLLKHQLIADITSEYIFGKGSKLYSKLYNDGLIDRSFSAGYTKFPEGGTFLVSGASKNPELVYEIVKNAFANLIIDEKVLENIIKTTIGSNVYSLDSFDDLCINQLESHFNGGDFSETFKILKQIKSEDIATFIAQISKHSAISMVKPN